MTGSEGAQSISTLYEKTKSALGTRLRFFGAVIFTLSLSVAVLVATMLFAMTRRAQATPSQAMMISVSVESILFIVIIVVLVVRAANTGRAVARGVIRFDRVLHEDEKLDQRPSQADADRQKTLDITQSLLEGESRRHDVAVSAVFFAVLCLVSAGALFLGVLRQGVDRHPFVYLMTLVGCASAIASQFILRKPSNVQAFLETMLEDLENGTQSSMSTNGLPRERNDLAAPSEVASLLPAGDAE